jgi:cytochrome c5
VWLIIRRFCPAVFEPEKHMGKIGIAHIGFLLAFAFLLSGCKVAILVVEGGDVESVSGTYSCLEGNVCVIEVTATDFDETLIAKPGDGYEFSHWLKGDKTFCGNSTDPNCRLTTTVFAGNEAIVPILASDTIFYLLPVFVKFTPPPPPGLSAREQAKYDVSCANCHPIGLFGSPRTHDEAAWAPRLAKGMSVLLNSVKNGKGQMPAGGQCSNCSDADYQALITYMSGPAS